jgi:taurine dioxygenase
MTEPTVEKIASALGTEIHGVDLARDLDDKAVAFIRNALLDHLVVFFRDQKLTPVQLADFGRRFGTLARYPFVDGLKEIPEVIEVKKLEHERVNFGGVWHSDTAYLEEPPIASMLFALEVPPTGGDTLFANMYATFDALSDGMKKLLAGLKAVNSSYMAGVTRTREDRIAANPGKAKGEAFEAVHPVVRTHPETGRKALYVNRAHTVRLDGMTNEESANLLAFLYDHQTKPEFTCRFRWWEGSLAFWDNRAAQHNPINDYHGFRRCMHRITLAGDKPR